MKKLMLVLIVAILSLPVYAKDKKEDAQPVLTEVEQLKLENIQLRAVPLNQQLAELQKQYEALVAQIEAEHPGYSWSAQAGKLLKNLPPAPEKK